MTPPAEASQKAVSGMTAQAFAPDAPANISMGANDTKFDTFSAHFHELFETLQDLRRQPASSGASKDSVLIRALAALSEANNIMAEQNNRINLLESLAVTDELTTLLNRRGFNVEMAKELKRVARSHSKGGLLITFDLDGFKQVNDNYGHPAGDACLVAVAQYLKKATRSTDIACRNGGDEFLVVLTNIDDVMAHRRLAQIVEGLNRLTFDWQDHRVRVNASHGTAAYDSTTQNIDDLIKDADIALYDMKQQHRADHASADAALAQKIG